MRIVYRVLCSAMLAGMLLPASASARESFFIPKDDGYGIGDCIASGGACAKAVADAWCAAMGRGPSVANGVAEGPALERIATRNEAGYRITCSD